MTKVYKLTHEHLLEVLAADLATGIFTWKVARSNRVKIGSRAGVFHRASGGRYISIDGENIRAHRLMFFYVNKRWPNTDVRPLDGDYDNCAIVNLKEVSRVELQHERAGAISTNTSGFAGVSRAGRGKWQTKVTWNYQQISLGASFDTAEDAAEMYQEAERRLKDCLTADERDRALEELRLWRRQRTVWNHLNRNFPNHVWASFEHFCGTVKEFPKARYAMAPRDMRYTIGPENFQWTMPIGDVGGLTGTAYNRAVREVRRDVVRDKDFRKKYGINYADYMVIFEKQGGLCLVCDRPEKKEQFGAIRLLSVDHDHEAEKRTGKVHVRGLLCGNCNQGIGYFGNDRPDLLRAAADYLDKYYGRKRPWSVPVMTEITHLPIGQKILMENRANG